MEENKQFGNTPETTVVFSQEMLSTIAEKADSELIINADSIEFDPAELEIALGSVVKNFITTTPLNAGLADLIWSSSDSSIVKIVEPNVILAAGIGEAVVTVVSKVNSEITATLTVTVVASIEESTEEDEPATEEPAAE